MFYKKLQKYRIIVLFTVLFLIAGFTVVYSIREANDNSYIRNDRQIYLDCQSISMKLVSLELATEGQWRKELDFNTRKSVNEIAFSSIEFSDCPQKSYDGTPYFIQIVNMEFRIFVGNNLQPYMHVPCYN